MGTIIAAIQSGCMCVRAVQTGGTHYRHLKASAVWTNSSAHVMVECSVWDTRLLSKKSQNLGTRYVCAPPVVWNEVISAAFENEKRVARLDPHTNTNKFRGISLRLDVSLTVTNAADVYTGGFVLVPPEIAATKDAAPPSNGWVRIAIPRYSESPRFPVTLGDQTLTVRIEQLTLPQNAQRYKDWWWYPNQVLLIPAYAVDIATSPIQFLIIMHSLSKIGK